MTQNGLQLLLLAGGRCYQGIEGGGLSAAAVIAHIFVRYRPMLWETKKWIIPTIPSRKAHNRFRVVNILNTPSSRVLAQRRSRFVHMFFFVFLSHATCSLPYHVPRRRTFLYGIGTDKPAWAMAADRQPKNRPLKTPDHFGADFPQDFPPRVSRSCWAAFEQKKKRFHKPTSTRPSRVNSVRGMKDEEKSFPTFSILFTASRVLLLLLCVSGCPKYACEFVCVLVPRSLLQRVCECLRVSEWEGSIKIWYICTVWRSQTPEHWIIIVRVSR